MSPLDLLALTAVDIDDEIWVGLNADRFNCLNAGLSDALAYHTL